MADGVRGATIEDCTVAHVATYAVWFRKGCREGALRCCELLDVGTGGARIGAMAVPASRDEYTKHIEIDNNIVRPGGLRLHAGGRVRRCRLDCQGPEHCLSASGDRPRIARRNSCREIGGSIVAGTRRVS